MRAETARRKLQEKYMRKPWFHSCTLEEPNGAVPYIALYVLDTATTPHHSFPAYWHDYRVEVRTVGVSYS